SQSTIPRAAAAVFYSISDATEMISLQRIQSNMACFQPFLK
ncbi:hypothetical protein LTSEWAN_4215, partial [Salmonella enterica subsp. enterica serovar Wandsworth str. A4-580]